MTTQLQVRFDGKVLVPEGPVDLPTHELLSVVVRRPVKPLPSASERRAAVARLLGMARSNPPLPDSALTSDAIYGDD